MFRPKFSSTLSALRRAALKDALLGALLAAFLAALLTALLAHAGLRDAQAQTTRADPRVTEEERERFRFCRAAALTHLQAADWRNAIVGEDMTRAMLQQISFIMAETTIAAPPANIADAERRIFFSEMFFLNLRDDLMKADSAFSETSVRDEALLDCSPFLWTVLSGHIDKLMEWRTQAFRNQQPAWRFDELTPAEPAR